MPHPWEASYPPECRWDVPIAQGTLPAFLDDIAARFGDRPALEYRGQVLGFAALRALSDRIAAGLMAMGVGRGDCVALYLPNTPWHPLVLLRRAAHRRARGAPLGARCEARARAQGCTIPARRC